MYKYRYLYAALSSTFDSHHTGSSSARIREVPVPIKHGHRKKMAVGLFTAVHFCLTVTV